jgi:transposase
MRLKISKSPNAASLYVIKSTYENGIHSSKIVEKLGTVSDLREKLGGRDPIEWAREYIKKLTIQEKERKQEIIARFSPVKTIVKDERRSYNGGYLFLQRIYRELRLDQISREISERHRFEYDLDSIFSRLIYGRVIFPASKLSTYIQSEKFIEPPKFELQHIYRALEILAKETDSIQSKLYNNSLRMSKRNTGVLYYDCTNYFFEIEQESGLRQYGYSKEHRPNPIVQMGLFMDGDGIPLAFSMTDGNTNEQKTLRPLEEKILSDFKLSRFVVCTDAGLSSAANRKFNDKGERAFITTQSIKKLKQHLKTWALGATGWQLSGSSNTYDITKLDDIGGRDEYTGFEDNEVREKTFYKTRWIKEDELEQQLIVTYSVKYRDYQRKIREGQIDRARNLIATNPKKLKKVNQNDYKRLISRKNVTPDGEIAKKEVYCIDDALIAEEEAFDGFYGVCTNLDDDVPSVIKVNHRRWEIEECFRIMKSEFKARPIYLKRDDRIRAHFLTCFAALIIFRLLEKRLDERFTCHEIIDGLRQMNFFKLHGEGYIPTYTRTDFTDALHEAFGFRTDYEIITLRSMKKIFSSCGT